MIVNMLLVDFPEDIDLDDGSTFDTPEELVFPAFNSLLRLASWHKINAEISP